MKILIIDLMFSWPPHGGACVDVKEVASRLVKRGFDVEMVVSYMPDMYPRGHVNGANLPFKVHQIEFSSVTFNALFVPRALRKVIDKVKPDFIYLGDSYFLKPYIINAAKGYKVVARFYTYELLCPNYYLLYKDGRICEKNYFETPIDCIRCATSSMKDEIISNNLSVWGQEYVGGFAFMPFYYEYAKKSLSKCHALITYNSLCGRLLSPYNNNVFVIPGGVDTSAFSRQSSAVSLNGKIKKIFVSGRLREGRKGLDVLLKAAAILRGKRDDFKIFATIDRPFSEDYIVPMGWVDHQNIVGIYQDMDICVIPSLWEEPFGMVATEAMACGKPVVASRAGGLRDSVEDGVTGFHFPPGDADALSEKIDILLDDPSLREKMGMAGRERAERLFDWDRIVDFYCEKIFT
ncbi:MAG: glycosyltransferase family 4 protein [Nitrospinae bacterium]|nr:glycosyltransferase family 4 protein [Nitrospinota bacterium]